MLSTFSNKIKDKISDIDWELFTILILTMNVKLAIKFVGIAFILFLIYKRKRKVFFFNKSVPKFYALIIILSLVRLLITAEFLNKNYLPVFITGLLFWIVPRIILGQLKNITDINSNEKIMNTVSLFFLMNCFVSIGELFLIMLETGTFNPYQYQGMNQKYFLSTGDNIKGITFDTSTTNALLNSFGVIYFLYKKNISLSLLCLVCVLLTGSNLTNAILLVSIIFIFVIRKDRDAKAIIVGCLAIIICFLGRISPENNNYLIATVDRIMGKKEIHSNIDTNKAVTNELKILSRDEERMKEVKAYLDSLSTIEVSKRKNLLKNQDSLKIAKIISPKDINSSFYQRKSASTINQVSLIERANQLNIDTNFMKTGYNYDRFPGKLIAYAQTLNFVKSKPICLLLGNGPGNFSSKLAFRVAGLSNVAGAWPAKYNYLCNDFEENHLSTYLYYFTKDESKHSIINSPNSVYNQLLGEYGIIGLILFAVFYAGFFVSKYKQLSYGIPLLLILLLSLTLDYWFEQMSIFILFELLMFLDLKIGKNQNEP